MGRKLADLTPEALEFLRSQSAELVPHELVFDYDWWSTGTQNSRSRLPLVFNVFVISDEVIHAILPEELEAGAPSGFAVVGHIGV